jgi:hypothetical protein
MFRPQLREQSLRQLELEAERALVREIRCGRSCAVGLEKTSLPSAKTITVSARWVSFGTAAQPSKTSSVPGLTCTRPRNSPARIGIGVPPAERISSIPPRRTSSVVSFVPRSESNVRLPSSW